MRLTTSNRPRDTFAYSFSHMNACHKPNYEMAKSAKTAKKQKKKNGNRTFPMSQENQFNFYSCSIRPAALPGAAKFHLSHFELSLKMGEKRKLVESRVQSSPVQSSHWLVSGFSGPWGVAIRGCIYILSIHVMWRHYKNCDPTSPSPPPSRSNPSSYFALCFSEKLPCIFYRVLFVMPNEGNTEKQTELYLIKNFTWSEHTPNFCNSAMFVRHEVDL